MAIRGPGISTISKLSLSLLLVGGDKSELQLGLVAMWGKNARVSEICSEIGVIITLYIAI